MATWHWTKGTHNTINYNPPYIEAENPSSISVCPYRTQLDKPEKQIACHIKSCSLIFTFQTCSQTLHDVITKLLTEHSIFCFPDFTDKTEVTLVNRDGTYCSYIADIVILGKPMHNQWEHYYLVI